MRQSLTDCPHASKARITILQLQCAENNVVLDGKAVRQTCQIVVDTGAIHTIVRRDLVPMCGLSESPGNYVITIAGGETFGVSGEILVNIGSKKIPQKFFGVNIIDSGMNFVKHHLVVLDVGKKSMMIGNEKLTLKTNREKRGGSGQAVLEEDNLIQARSEMVTTITLDEDLQGMIIADTDASTAGVGISFMLQLLPRVIA